MSVILKEFYDSKTNSCAKGGIAIVAQRKIVLSQEVQKGLNLDKITENDNPQIDVIVHPDKALLLIGVSENGNCVLSGTKFHPEIYCAPICKAVFARLKIKLIHAGTIRFPEVEYATDQETNNTYAIVNLEKFSANDGVYEKENLED